jgi:hypothetical protein
VGAAGSATGEPGSIEPAMPEVCEQYRAAAAPRARSLIVQNDREGSIFLTGAAMCQNQYLKIESLVVGAAGISEGQHCKTLCADALVGSGGCTANCPAPPTVEIEPGAAFTIEWDGLIYDVNDTPETCCDPTTGCGAEECFTPIQAPAGSYQATVGLLDTMDGSGCPGVDAGTCLADSIFPFDLPTELVTMDFELGDEVVMLRIE